MDLSPPLCCHQKSSMLAHAMLVYSTSLEWTSSRLQTTTITLPAATVIHAKGMDGLRRIIPTSPPCVVLRTNDIFYFLSNPEAAIDRWTINAANVLRMYVHRQGPQAISTTF